MSQRMHASSRAAKHKARTAKPLGRGVTTVLLFAAAAVLLFEEWLWDHSTAIAKRLGRLPPLALLEAWIRRRSQWQAMALFVLPVIVVYPLKAVALYAMTRGYVTVGVSSFVLAKILATAVFARLFQLTEPAITRIRWVRHGRDAFLRWRAFMHRWLNSQPAYRNARATIRDASARLRLRYRAAYRLRRRQRRSARSRKFLISRDAAHDLHGYRRKTSHARKSSRVH
jgi:hypothetical protein